MLKRELLTSILLGLCVSAASAQSVEQRLQSIRQDLQKQQQSEQRIAKEKVALQKEISKLETQSSTLMQSINGLNRTITRQRQERRALKIQQRAKQARLETSRQMMGKLLYGIVRMQQLPRQFVIGQPTDSETIVRSAGAMQLAYDATQQHMQTVQSEYKALADNEAALQTKEAAILENQQKLAQEQASLQRTINQRQKRAAALQQDQASYEARIKMLKEQSVSLQDLIARLAQEEQRFAAITTPPSKPKAPDRDSIAFYSRRGSIPLPSPGTVIHRFGERKSANDRFSGIVVRTSANAPVSTPHAGKIVFTGTFMDYGNMVIIQHDRSHHSVIAGMDIVRVSPGQRLGSGSLIGVMGATGKAKELYYELRKNSKAIDPAGWIANVGRI